MKKIAFTEYLKQQRYYWFELDTTITLENEFVYIECDICYIINDKRLYNTIKKIVIDNNIEYIESKGRLYFDSCNSKYLHYLFDYQLKSYRVQNLYTTYKLLY